MLDNKLIFIIGFGIVFVMIIILLLCKSNKKNNILDSDISILDIEESGVPNSSESSSFSYGYEKEETIAMDPIKAEKE